MRLKKFLNKLDTLYLIGKKVKQRGLVKVDYGMTPERIISFRVFTVTESTNHGPISVRTKKQRSKAFKIISKTVLGDKPLNLGK